MKFEYVYVIRSSRDGNFYVGLTNDLAKRLDQHNSGKVPSTRNRVPFDLIYWEGCLNRSDAVRREKYLKTAWGKRYIKTRIQQYLTG
jgi:putative endonuclease